MSHNTNDFTNVSHSRCYRISSTSSIKIGWGKRAFVWCIMLCVPILLFSQQITGDKFDSYVDSLSSDTIHISHHPKMQKLKKKVKHTGSILYRFVKSFDDYDTTYISPNYYNYTAMLQNTNYFQVYKLQGRGENGIRQTIATKPAPNVKIGPYFGWRWIFLGYTFDVSHPKALGESSELDFSLYSSMLGCDFVFIIWLLQDWMPRRCHSVPITCSIIGTSHTPRLIIKARFSAKAVDLPCLEWAIVTNTSVLIIRSFLKYCLEVQIMTI